MNVKYNWTAKPSGARADAFDFCNINREEVARLYNLSDIDCLRYVVEHTKGEPHFMAEVLYYSNLKWIEGEPVDKKFDRFLPNESEYHNLKRTLLSNFGIEFDKLGEAFYSEYSDYEDEREL